MADAETARQLTARLMLLIDQPEGTQRAIVMIAAAIADAEARVRQEYEQGSDYARFAAAHPELLAKATAETEADELRAEVSALSARLAAVEQALREYGVHRALCAKVGGYGGYATSSCTCGLSAALGDPQ